MTPAALLLLAVGSGLAIRARVGVRVRGLRTDPELAETVPSVRDGLPPKPPGRRPGDRLVQAFRVSERR